MFYFSDMEEQSEDDSEGMTNYKLELSRAHALRTWCSHACDSVPNVLTTLTQIKLEHVAQ